MTTSQNIGAASAAPAVPLPTPMSMIGIRAHKICLKFYDSLLKKTDYSLNPLELGPLMVYISYGDCNFNFILLKVNTDYISQVQVMNTDKDPEYKCS